MVVTKIKSCILSLVSFPVAVRYNNAAESVINLRARGTPVNAFIPQNAINLIAQKIRVKCKSVILIKIT